MYTNDLNIMFIIELIILLLWILFVIVGVKKYLKLSYIPFIFTILIFIINWILNTILKSDIQEISYRGIILSIITIILLIYSLFYLVKDIVYIYKNYVNIILTKNEKILTVFWMIIVIVCIINII